MPDRMPLYPSIAASNQRLKPLVVFGMHRSGTSLLSRCLHNSGVFMGMMQEHNAEAVQFLSLNEQALKKAGADWIEPLELPKGTFAHLKAVDLYREHFKLSMRSGLWLRFKANYRWGWKDPRNTFALAAWTEVFPNARLLHLYRDGRAVAMSLWNRNLREAESGRDARLGDPVLCFRVWERYLEQVERWDAGGFKIAHISYEHLVRGSGWSELEKNLGISIRRPEIDRSAKDDFPIDLIEAAQQSAVYQRWKARGLWL